MKILIKLPNKLGDTIISTVFINALHELYPESHIHIIIKKEIAELAKFIPQAERTYEFSKKEYSGPIGLMRFGNMIKRAEKYDLFFCLPFSFSAALVGFIAGCRNRVGFKEEHRGILLTKGYKRPPRLHEAEEHIYLLEQYFNTNIPFKPYKFNLPNAEIQDFVPSGEKYIVLNTKSGAQSRTIPVSKAVSLTHALMDNFPHRVVLIGSPGEKEFIDEIEKGVNDPAGRIINLAGKTNLIQLAQIIKNAEGMISSDSGNAHMANALGTKLIVFFGAGDEVRTRPLNPEGLRILRKPSMACAPCHPETCPFGDPKCIVEIENTLIINTFKELLNA